MPDFENHLEVDQMSCVLSYESASRLLRYDANEGKFYWLQRTPDMFEDSKVTREGSCKNWNAKYAGKEVRVYDCSSKQISLYGKLYSANKIACLLKMGHWPQHHVRHLDGDKSNLRWSNLAFSKHEKIGPNLLSPPPHTNPHKGVSWHKRSSMWQAHISIDKHRVHLGYFIDLDDAIAARKKAEDDKERKRRSALNEKLAREMGIWPED